jgi:hypothetical protein
MIVKVLLIFMVLPGLFNSFAFAEGAGNSGVFFSVADHWQPGLHSTAEKLEGRFVQGWFNPGLDVVLIGEKGICTAKTGRTVRFVETKGPTTKGTVLVGEQGCHGDFDLAVFGVERSAIHLIPTRHDASSVPKDLVSKARRLLKSTPNLGDSLPVSQSPTNVVRMGHVALLSFGRGWTGYGPSVLVVNNNIFPLAKQLVDRPLFFSINNKLHLTCLWAGGNVARIYRVVYDLSGGAPKKVYDELKDSDLDLGQVGAGMRLKR